MKLFAGPRIPLLVPCAMSPLRRRFPRAPYQDHTGEQGALRGRPKGQTLRRLHHRRAVNPFRQCGSEREPGDREVRDVNAIANPFRQYRVLFLMLHSGTVTILSPNAGAEEVMPQIVEGRRARRHHNHGAIAARIGLGYELSGDGGIAVFTRLRAEGFKSTSRAPKPPVLTRDASHRLTREPQR